MENNGQRLKRENFAPLLNKAICGVKYKEILANGFRACGLFPFTPDAIKYSALITKNSVDVENNIPALTSVEKNNYLHYFESRLSVEKLNEFKKSDTIWIGHIADTNLFYFWLSLKKDAAPEEDNPKVAEPTYDRSQEDNQVDIIDDTWLNDVLGDRTSIELVIDETGQAIQMETNKNTIDSLINSEGGEVDLLPFGESSEADILNGMISIYFLRPSFSMFS